MGRPCLLAGLASGGARIARRLAGIAVAPRAGLRRVVAVGDVVLRMLARVDPGAGGLLLRIALTGGVRAVGRFVLFLLVDGHAGLVPAGAMRIARRLGAGA